MKTFKIKDLMVSIQPFNEILSGSGESDSGCKSTTQCTNKTRPEDSDSDAFCKSTTQCTNKTHVEDDLGATCKSTTHCTNKTRPEDSDSDSGCKSTTNCVNNTHPIEENSKMMFRSLRDAEELDVLKKAIADLQAKNSPVLN